MGINIFEGARRISMLSAGVATIATVIGLIAYEPYTSADYSIEHPLAPFKSMEESCPSDAASHYFTSKTSSGKEVAIDLCIIAMSFGKKADRLIPYKVDEQGTIWGAPTYSSEVSEYERKLEKRFAIPKSDEAEIEERISARYRENMKEGFGYLVIGLVIFGGLVWAIGWIVRGFLGIPRGQDKRPEGM